MRDSGIEEWGLENTVAERRGTHRKCGSRSKNIPEEGKRKEQK